MINSVALNYCRIKTRHNIIHKNKSYKYIPEKEPNDSKILFTVMMISSLAIWVIAPPSIRR
jgi:hypothetical protein